MTHFRNRFGRRGGMVLLGAGLVALVVEGLDPARIRAAWAPLASGPGRPAHDLVVVEGVEASNGSSEHE